MANYTYAKKADLYVFQSSWDAVCAKNTFCIINYRPRKLVHLKCNKVIVGKSKSVKISRRGKNPSCNFYKSKDKHKENSNVREFHGTQYGQSHLHSYYTPTT
jgi:hypothetical protein